MNRLKSLTRWLFHMPHAEVEALATALLQLAAQELVFLHHGVEEHVAQVAEALRAQVLASRSLPSLYSVPTDVRRWARYWDVCGASKSDDAWVVLCLELEESRRWELSQRAPAESEELLLRHDVPDPYDGLPEFTRRGSRRAVR